MCPICILTYLVYYVCGALGLIGLHKLVEKIKIKYYKWSNTKCEVCKKYEKIKDADN
jgi:uncharacterized membrane protein YgdD (TMEM256/DUF423 family)